MTSESISASAFGNREFELHLHVLEHRHGGSASRYTIGIWEHTPQGATLRAICHIRPLSVALLAIGEEFDENARREGFEIVYPQWSEIAGLIEHLRNRNELGLSSAANMLEEFQTRLQNTTAELQLVLERLTILGTMIEEAAAHLRPTS